MRWRREIVWTACDQSCGWGSGGAAAAILSHDSHLAMLRHSSAALKGR